MKTQSAQAKRNLRKNGPSGGGKRARNAAAPSPTQPKEPNPLETLESEGGVQADQPGPIPFASTYSERLMT
jgi:hypothetical protein